MAHVTTSQLYRRVWIEAGLGGLSAALFAITLAWPDWLELVLRIDPDAGSGALEWALALLTSIIALACFALARRDWSRAREQSARERVA